MKVKDLVEMLLKLNQEAEIGDPPEDLIKTIYNRAKQVYIAKYGSSFEHLRIDDDGTIYGAEFNKYDRDYEYSDIPLSELNDDLDKLIEQRLMREKQEKEEKELEMKRLSEQRKKDEKKHRQELYLKLKKEFENN